MPTGGRLELQLEFAEMMGEVRFRISDSGPGITLADRERVLEPFVSTKPGHAGLGLTAARDVARAHGGRLEIATSPHGPGFTVAIAIPLTQRR
jgi:signal transduction histidine kinase